jgi:anaerobic selenocysteine-containing dehydrogenase
MGAKKNGAKIILIDPRYTDTAIAFADEWIPIKPTTDNAMMDAMGYVIVTEKLHDQAFLDKYCVGFDGDHMPEGVSKEESLISYLLGEMDGVPKTPEWAEKITWVPAKEIRKLARLYAQLDGASIFQGTNTQDQTANGTQNSRAFSILQTITGNINNPGGWVISPRLVLTGVGLPTEKIPIGAENYRIFYEIWGRKSPYGQVVCFPDSVPNPIRALIVTGGNPLISMPDSNAFREALKKLDL